MKAFHKISTLLLLGLLVSTTSLFAQKSTAGKAAESAKEAQGKVEKAAKEIKDLAKEIDCPKPKAADKQKLKKAVETAREELAKAKEAAKKAWEAATSASDKEKADAKAAAKAADKAVEEAEKALKGALGDTPGIEAADKIKEQLDKEDVSDNSKKKEIRDQLKKAAEDAGYDNPCDPDLVKKKVEQQLEELMKKYEKSNKELYKWLKELKDGLKNKALISFEPNGIKGGDLARGTGPAIGSGMIEPKPLAGIEIFGGLVFSSGKEASWLAGSVFDSVRRKSYADPAIFEQLFEKVGGEFFYGDFTQPNQAPQLGDTQRSTGTSAGLNVGWKSIPGLSLDAGLSLTRSQVNAVFPVVVFEFNVHRPQTLQGQLNFNITDLRARIGGNYFFSGGIVRPFAGGGVQYTRTTTSGARGIIAGVDIPVILDFHNNSIGAFGTAGIEVQTGTGFFLKAALSACSEKVQTGPRQSENVLTPAIAAGIGWQF